MTWSRIGENPTPLSVHTINGPDGEVHVRLTIGSTNASVTLSEEDAASLGGYLLGVTNNGPEPTEAPFPSGTTTIDGSSVQVINPEPTTYPKPGKGF